MNDLIQKIDSELSKSAPQGAVDIVTKRLNVVSDKIKAFNRSNSQTTLSHMSLTMLTGQSPLRQIRQILAEIDQRRTVLAEVQVGYAKMLEDAPNPDSSPEVFEAESRLRSFQITNFEDKIAGSIKDLATLIHVYDNLVKEHDLSEWTEEDFEKAEARHHVRRGFELLYRNVIVNGRPAESTVEYLQQFGVHVQIAFLEVTGYTTHVENMVSEGQYATGAHLEDFLDEMADKYVGCVAEASMRMFGVENITNRDFMNVWKS